MRATLPCDAILFDLDGVLVDSRAVVERTWHRWVALHNVNIPDLVQRAHGRRSVDTIRAVAPGLDADEEVRWLAEAELSDFDGVVALPGALTSIASLSEIQRAVVTSGGRDLARGRLVHVGLPVPEVLVAAEDVREGKPSAEGYAAAARQLNVSPSRCVVIEDTPAGVQAGLAAGARVIALSTTFPEAAVAAADFVLESLAEVRIIRVGAGIVLEINREVA